jgi:3'-5' exoribonuclease 1
VEDEGEVEWRLEVVDEFHSFVKPTWRPKLSAFCTELTGIKQVSTLCWLLVRHPGHLTLTAVSTFAITVPPSPTAALVRSHPHSRPASIHCTLQSDVSAAPTYPELLRLFKASFVDKHALFTRENRTVWVTDGPWGEHTTSERAGAQI